MLGKANNTVVILNVNKQFLPIKHTNKKCMSIWLLISRQKFHNKNLTHSKKFISFNYNNKDIIKLFTFMPFSMSYDIK